ncbi:hypothetical protein TRFO_15067 [Tritrichomonas foetus]|uniref:Uncharacterized protein n=1 Tax=Tritrichomonas foetus TaxID=1144522 RepID=A0A1J4KUG5_9EUKA|nr:hypothetical protein TRFO_15067 [Tritrichomonas foetus]|eukprot:OHT14536.1 hypothetical protein TRFO_15067 [Tritrichomonas foetus]
MKTPSEFVCKNASPGIGCGLPEMLCLGIFYLISGFYCFINFVFHVRKSIKTDTKNNSSGAISKLFGTFWLSMFVWLTYDGVITIVPFNYSNLTFRIFYLGLDLILYLIPLSFFVLVVLEFSFAWRNPSNKVVKFFRVVFTIFLSVYLVTGALLSLIEPDPNEDPCINLYLWVASTDLLISLFIIVPAFQLIKLISEPVVQPEDVCCVHSSKIGAVLFFIVFMARFAFNIVRLTTIDPLGDWASHKSNVLSRLYKFAQGFIFNLGAAWLAIVGTSILQRYDFKFLDESTYARQQNMMLPA